jgi:hypothetical protein
MPTLEYPMHARQTLKNSSPTPQAPQHAVSNLTGRGAVDAGGRENRVAGEYGTWKRVSYKREGERRRRSSDCTCIPLPPQGHAPIHGLGRDF